MSMDQNPGYLLYGGDYTTQKIDSQLTQPSFLIG